MRRAVGLGIPLALAVTVVTALVFRERLVQDEPAGMLPRDPGADVRYVALGDSSAVGVGASRPELTYVQRIHTRLRAVYPRADLDNLAVSGATSSDVLEQQIPSAIALHPHLLTISVGPNDVRDGISAASFEANLGAIFRELATETRAALVMNLLPDLSLTPQLNATQRAGIGEQTVRFNQAIERQARHFGVEVIDLYSASREVAADIPNLVSSDLYHPSDEGYALWAGRMWQGVEARIPTTEAGARIGR